MSALEPGAVLCESRRALPRHVAALRRAAVEFAFDAGADELALENIGLATSEAVTNAVVHAYPADGQDALVTVSAWLDDDGAIVVTVCDEGRGMLPRDDSPGLGWGLPLIAQVTERFEIEDRAPDHGVRLRMTFGLRGD